MQNRIAAVVFIISAIGAATDVAPAAANPEQDKIISTYCDNRPDPEACNDWRYNRNSWTHQQYRQFFREHQSDPAFTSAKIEASFGPPVNSAVSTEVIDPGIAPVRDPLDTSSYAATVSPTSRMPAVSPARGEGAIISTPTGTVVKTVPEVIGDSPTHVRDCMATFKSYNPVTDTYMGLSGERQRCKL